MSERRFELSEFAQQQRDRLRTGAIRNYAGHPVESDPSATTKRN